MKVNKKNILFYVIFILAVGLNCFSVKAMEKEIIDIDGHWAEKGIQKSINGGYASGYNSLFRPNDCITRVEFITLINKYFGYSSEGTITFGDVSKNSWYY